MQSALFGVVGGQVNQDGTACFWVGDPEKRIILVWPEGYYARETPLRVLDEKGRTVATVGKPVSLGGGRIPTGARAIVGCPSTSEVFQVGDVEH